MGVAKRTRKFATARDLKLADHENLMKLKGPKTNSSNRSKD